MFFFWFAVIIVVIFWPVGLHETLALLTSQLHPDANHKGDLVFLQDVFSEKSLSYIMKVEEISLKSFTNCDSAPADDKSILPCRVGYRICVFRFYIYCFQLASCLYCRGTSSLCVACTFKIHDKLKEYEKHSPSPVLHSASCLAEDVSVIFFQCIY